MTDGRATVDASTPGVAESIAALVDLVVEAGGTVHPQMRVVERAGALSVHLQGDDDGQPLVRLPELLLVPVDDLGWDSDPGRIAVTRGRAALGADQLRALDLMLDVYNRTGKAGWAQRHLPGCSLPRNGAALAAVQRAVPEFAERTSVAEIFIGSRIYSHRTTPEGPTSNVLMPIVDYLDHHRRGAPLRVVDGVMVIGVRRPDDPTSCRVTYGPRRSPLDTALHYGFVDSTATHARSLGVTVDEVDGPIGGAVVVEGQPRRALSPLDPPDISVEGGQLHLSHLTFDVTHPDRIVGILALGLIAVARRSALTVADPEVAARWLVGEVARRNVGLLDQLASDLIAAGGAGADGVMDDTTGAAGELWPPPSWGTVAEGLAYQRNLIVEAAAAVGA